jgi:segregation and condensation protein A
MSADATPHRQLTLDVEEEVFRHLVFHRSLIDDKDEVLYQRLEKYLDVLKGLKEGVHVTIKDPYSRSIAMVLELATEEFLDPWDVDLVRFCKLFMKKFAALERLDLMVVGKLIRMAYTVHNKKSINTLRKAELPSQDDDRDEDPFGEWMEDDETFAVTKSILTSGRPMLNESLLHRGDRPVTLLDLLNALEDVEGEMEVLREERRVRLETRQRLEKESRQNIRDKVYNENLEQDLTLTWQRVNQFNGHPIPLSQIEEGFELDLSSTLISLLYLAKMERVLLWQRSFPQGEIMVKNIGKDMSGLEYGELEENLEKAMAGEVRINKPAELIVDERPIPPNWNT